MFRKFELQYLKATFQFCSYWNKKTEIISGTFRVLPSMSQLRFEWLNLLIPRAVATVLSKGGSVNPAHDLEAWAVPYWAGSVLQLLVSVVWPLCFCHTRLPRDRGPVPFSDLYTRSVWLIYSSMMLKLVVQIMKEKALTTCRNDTISQRHCVH